jgi:hypothetical protein
VESRANRLPHVPYKRRASGFFVFRRGKKMAYHNQQNQTAFGRPDQHFSLPLTKPITATVYLISTSLGEEEFSFFIFHFNQKNK